MGTSNQRHSLLLILSIIGYSARLGTSAINWKLKNACARARLENFVKKSRRIRHVPTKRSTCCFQTLIQNEKKTMHRIVEREQYQTITPLYSRNAQAKWRSSGSFLPLKMALLPIPVESLEQVLTPKLPTPAQYASYWGRTSREQYNAGFEAFGVSFLGVFAAYFLSFAIGQFIATILGMIAGSWLLLGPELKAYQRNWELTSGRQLVDPWIDDDDDDDDFFNVDEDKRGLYGAFYLGRIEHVCVVDYPSDPPEDEYPLDEFEDYTMEKDEQERETGTPYSLRLRVTDETDFDEGRELQIHTRMSEEYLDLERGMPVCTILLSTSQKFQTLTAITDFCVPDAGPCWVGDYPYLDRPALEDMFIKDEYLWESLRDEGRGRWDVGFEVSEDYY